MDIARVATPLHGRTHLVVPERAPLEEGGKVKTEIPEKFQRLQRPLTYLLVAILSATALAYVHGWRIIEFWHTANWEDAVFFQYTSGQIHSLADCIRNKGPWPGLYRPLTTNLYYYLGSLTVGNRVEAY